MPKERAKDFAFSARLIKARDARDLKQKELAKAIGVSERSVKSWENGDRPKPSNVVKLASALRVSAHWLATGEGESGFTENDGAPRRKQAQEAAKPYADVHRRIRERLNRRFGDRLADSTVDIAAEADDILAGIDENYRRELLLLDRILGLK